MIREKRKDIPVPIRAAIEKVKDALRAIYSDRLSGVYLYGSYARGDFRDGSDIDLMITLEGEVKPYQEINRVSEVLSEISLSYDVLVSIYPVPTAWLKERKGPLFENVRREGIEL